VIADVLPADNERNAMTTTGAAPEAIHADPLVARDAAVIGRWNAITERTLAENAVPIPPSGLYYAFTALAMYDAVVTIEGRFEPWAPQLRAHAHASPQVPAATAAYRVLSHYFPNSQAALAADYASELGDVPDGVGKVHGIRVDEASRVRPVTLGRAAVVGVAHVSKG